MKHCLQPYQIHQASLHHQLSLPDFSHPTSSFFLSVKESFHKLIIKEFGYENLLRSDL